MTNLAIAISNEHDSDTEYKDGDDGGFNHYILSIQSADNGYIIRMEYDEGDLLEVFPTKPELIKRLEEIL